MDSFSSNSRLAGRLSRGPNAPESDDQDISDGFERMSMRGYRPDSSMSELSMDGARSPYYHNRQDAPSRGSSYHEQQNRAPYQEQYRGGGYQGGQGRGGGYGNVRPGPNDTRGYYNHDYRGYPQSQDRRGGGGGYQGGPSRGRGGRGRGEGHGLNNVYRLPVQQNNRRHYQQAIRPEDYETSNLEDFDGPSSGQDRSESRASIASFLDNSFTNAQGLPEMPEGVDAIEPLPEFDEAAIADEQDKIKTIHDILTRNPLDNEKKDKPLEPEVVSVDDLFDRIRRRAPKKVLFDYPSSLTKYLEQRKFLFHIGLCKKQPTNTGFAHRRGMQDIVSFIQRYYVYVHGCKLSDLLKFCQDQRFFRVYDPDLWRNQAWNDTYFFYRTVTIEKVMRILEDYGDYFEVTENEENPEEGYVKLKPLAKTIPSLWNKEILPKHPTEPYWDGSRKSLHMVHFASVTPVYAKCLIQLGALIGRSVYTLGVHVGLANMDLRSTFPQGTIGLCMAHHTSGVKNDLKGLKVAPYDIYNTRRNKIYTRSFIPDEEVDKLTEQAAQPSTSSGHSESVGLDGDAKLLLHRAVKWEREAISFVDNILGYDSLSEEQLRNALIGNLGPFEDTGEIATFISNHPHLYDINPQQLTAFRLDVQERDQHVAFLRYLAKKGNMGATYPEMMSDLKVGKAGYYLQKICMEGTFGTFFNRINVLFTEFKVCDPRETRYKIRGTLFDSEGICLPQFDIGYTVV